MKRPTAIGLSMALLAGTSATAQTFNHAVGLTGSSCGPDINDNRRLGSIRASGEESEQNRTSSERQRAHG